MVTHIPSEGQVLPGGGYSQVPSLGLNPSGPNRRRHRTYVAPLSFPGQSPHVIAQPPLSPLDMGIDKPHGDIVHSLGPQADPAVVPVNRGLYAGHPVPSGTTTARAPTHQGEEMVATMPYPKDGVYAAHNKIGVKAEATEDEHTAHGAPKRADGGNTSKRSAQEIYQRQWPAAEKTRAPEQPLRTAQNFLPPTAPYGNGLDPGRQSGSEDSGYRHPHRPRHHHRHRERTGSSSSRSSMGRHKRERSPGMPKMMVYTRTGNWEPFIFEFERIAERCNWRPSKKTEKLLDCLADQALEYAQRRSLNSDYDDLKGGLSQRFMNKATAAVARKQLHSVKQREDETLESYSQQVHFLTINEPTVQQIATEAFLLGCKDKRAAEKVMKREPKTIYAAQTMVKTISNNHRALFGHQPPD